MAAERPLLGWGAGNFVAANGPFSSIDRFRFLHQKGPFFLFADFTVHSHNEFLEILVELGVVGLGVYLFLLFWVALKGAAGSKKITMPAIRFSLYGLLGGFIGLSVQSFFSVGLRYWDQAPYFWTSVGMLLAAGAVGSLKQGEKVPPLLRLSLRGWVVRLVIFLMLAALVIFFWYQVVWRGFNAQMDLYQADILSEKGEYARAVPYYHKAKDGAFIYSDLVRSQYGLSGALLRLGRWPEAKDALETVNSLCADFIYTNLLLAQVYEHLGEKKKALVFFRRYQRQNPYDERLPEKIEALVKEIEGGDAP
jgi:hypothetical protein